MTDSVAAPAAAPGLAEGRRPRSAWLVAVLALLCSGLGHLYLGRVRLAIAFAAALLPWQLAWCWVAVTASSPAIRLLSAAMLAAGLAAAPVHATLVARAERAPGTPRPVGPRWWGYALYVLLVVVINGQAREYLLANVFRAFRVPGATMAPAILPGDYVLTRPKVRGAVERGAPIVYRSPMVPFVVSRVVGLPGDTLAMRDRVLYVNGVAQDEPYAHAPLRIAPVPSEEMEWQREFLVGASAAAGSYEPTADDWGPLAIPEGRYFVLGDNRHESYDSRYLGFIDRADLFGRPAWIYASVSPVTGWRWERLGRTVR